MDIGTLSKQIIDHIDKIITDVPTPVSDIAERAINYYGEDFVDLQLNQDLFVWNNFMRRTLKEIIQALHIQHKLSDELRKEIEREVERGHYSYQSIADLNLLDTFLGWLDEETLQKCPLPIYSILIHFHEFDVINEEDKSAHIEDMYARVDLDYNGRFIGRMEWARATYSYEHYRNGYRHSHLTQFRQASSSASWSTPCLGEGPINMTIESLRSPVNLDLWSLFWLELDRCIRTESLRGGPYFRMYDITKARTTGTPIRGFINIVATNLSWMRNINEDTLMRRIIRSGKLRLAYKAGRIVITNDFIDFTVLISRVYLNLLKLQGIDNAIRVVSDLISNGFMYRGKIKSDHTIIPMLDQYNDSPVGPLSTSFIFHGQPVTRIVREKEREEEDVLFTLFNPNIVCRCHRYLTLIINYVYGKESKNSSKDSNS